MPRRRLVRALVSAAIAALVVLAAAAPAGAVLERPVTIDGPSGQIAEFGGVAIASDGTGGLVYTKVVDGVPHVFAARYVGGNWGAPIRVDDQPYDATSPRIAAGRGGQLLVVWVTQIATVHGEVQRGLLSASLGPGAKAFGPSLVVDGNVGSGTGVTPSIAGVAPGVALVAYRAITDDFVPAADKPGDVQVRPGDVLAEVRLARLAGDRWSRLGAVNRDPTVSTRPPTIANAPQVDIGDDGGGVVAWQEPDATGTARIWARRVFGNVPGPLLQASPSDLNGQPVTADADAPSLDVSPLDMAAVTMRIASTPGSALAGRLLVNTLPVGEADKSGLFTGPLVADGAGAAAPDGGASAPDAAVADAGANGLEHVAYAAKGGAFVVGGDSTGLGARRFLGPAVSGASAVNAVGADGGAVEAWPAPDGAGGVGVSVRQELASGRAQSGLVSGARSGAVSSLAIGRASTGDAIVGFLQGDPGRAEVVGERISAPPASFVVSTPDNWVAPRAATVTWEEATSGVTGGVSYGVLLDGRTVAHGLRNRRYVPGADLLGSGTHHVQVVATDGAGQQVTSARADLKVDSRPPTARVTHVKPNRKKKIGTRAIVVRVADPQSGVRTTRTDASFGDHSRLSAKHRNFSHTYKRAGHYKITVHTRDTVGNATTLHLKVTVK